MVPEVLLILSELQITSIITVLQIRNCSPFGFMFNVVSEKYEHMPYKSLESIFEVCPEHLPIMARHN